MAAGRPDKTASAHAVEAGSKAPLLAELGWRQVEKILKRAA